jgi:hypothetical protein
MELLALLPLELAPVKWRWYLATQCLLQTKPKLMRINIEGELQKGVVSKDINPLYYFTNFSKWSHRLFC